MDKLIQLSKDICTTVSFYVAAYFDGRETAENERQARNNQRPKAGLKAAMHGEYAAGASRRRPRAIK